MARHKAGPKSSRLDPANCTAPNPSEVEDFVMRRQSLELKEVRQSIFFPEVLKLILKRVVSCCFIVFQYQNFPISACCVFFVHQLASTETAR